MDVAAKDPIIVGTVGRLNPESPEFGKHLERFRKDKLFLGIRQLQLGPALDKPAFVANLKLLADAGLSLDVIPANRDDGAGELLRLTDLVPNLRLIVEHYPRAKTPDARAARDAYMADLRQLKQISGSSCTE